METMNKKTKNYVADEAIRMRRIATDVLARPFVNGKEMGETEYREILNYVCAFTETYLNQDGRRDRPLTSKELVMVLSSGIKWALEATTTRRQL